MSTPSAGAPIEAFGDPIRHYSGEAPRIANRKLTGAERRLLDLLNELDPKLEERKRPVSLLITHKFDPGLPDALDVE
jgi:hypothetical protein